MKKVTIIIFTLVLFILLSGMVSAEEIDSVILASDSHYPDALVGGVAANRIGAPLLLTEKNKLSDEAMEEIGNLSVSKIYIIGGPYAVSEKVENELAGNYTVVRLWGMTRYGTSAAVAEYFWEESSKAILVWDVLGLPAAGNSEMIAKARDLAQGNDAPLLLIPRNTLPEAVSNALANMSVSEVILIGNIGSQVEDDLTEMGINISDRIAGEPAEIKKNITERVKNLLGKKRPLVVIAVGNWSDVIQAPYKPNGTSRHISSEDQIDELIEEINQENYTRIMIVGKPELAQTIYDRLAEAGINATLISGRQAGVAARIMRLEREIIRERARLHRLGIRTALLMGRASNLSERTENLINALNATLQRLEAAGANINSTAILSKVIILRDRIKNRLNSENYEDALENYKILENEHEQLRLRNIAVLRAEINSIISRESARPLIIRRIIRR